ncbi:hypothetical protein CDV31_012358 [Fusarium ambrosium]|uniref:Uncharacterized protein n=1 Tax=Fusarium ambrosium TaxID=131363 RepID=A0A428TAJ1_9HYPO|nr:hypothetical protein CDV31_012358 [Fusarium ambrosium]
MGISEVSFVINSIMAYLFLPSSAPSPKPPLLQRYSTPSIMVKKYSQSGSFFETGTISAEPGSLAIPSHSSKRT